MQIQDLYSLLSDNSYKSNYFFEPYMAQKSYWSTPLVEKAHYSLPDSLLMHKPQCYTTMGFLLEINSIYVIIDKILYIYNIKSSTYKSITTIPELVTSVGICKPKPNIFRPEISVLRQ